MFRLFIIWILSGFIPNLIYILFAFFTEKRKIKFLKDSFSDWQSWVLLIISTLGGPFNLLFWIFIGGLAIHSEIEYRKIEMRKFFENTPWYQQEKFGGWKKYGKNQSLELDDD